MKKLIKYKFTESVFFKDDNIQNILEEYLIIIYLNKVKHETK